MSTRPKLFLLVFAFALPCATIAQTRGAGSTGGSIPAKPAASQSQVGSPLEPGRPDPHDLTGIWNMSFPQGATQADLEVYVSQFGKGEPPMTAWAKERFDKTKPAFGPRGVLVAQTNDPAFQCFPPGVPRIYLHPFPMQITQTPKELIMVFEYDHNVRHIYTDGRKPPADLTSTYMGYSTGHWDGDTFVIDTVGFNDKTWLDPMGLPHSDAMHVTERMHRVDQETLENTYTIDDPKTYAKPWTASKTFKLKPDWEIKEYVCAENNTVK